MPQFGRNIGHIDSFRWYFKQTLELAMAVYPDAKVDIEPKGLVLNPSKPPRCAKDFFRVDQAVRGLVKDF